MVRIVRNKEGKVFVDETGKIRGRGANLCENAECFKKAIKKSLIEKALNLEKKLSEEEVSSMFKDFERILYERDFRKGKKAVSFRINKEDLERINKGNGKANQEKN